MLPATNNAGVTGCKDRAQERLIQALFKINSQIGVVFLIIKMRRAVNRPIEPLVMTPTVIAAIAHLTLEERRWLILSQLDLQPLARLIPAVMVRTIVIAITTVRRHVIHRTISRARKAQISNLIDNLASAHGVCLISS